MKTKTRPKARRKPPAQAPSRESRERWVEDSEKRVVNTERQLAKLVVHAYEQDPDSVPEQFRMAVADVRAAKETEKEARDALIRWPLP